jgi:hypothetical protein
VTDVAILTPGKAYVSTAGATTTGGHGTGLTLNTIAGTTLNANACRLWHVFFETCGDRASNGNPSQWAGLYMHSMNTNGAVVGGTFAQNCNVGYVDGTLGGATWGWLLQ